MFTKTGRRSDAVAAYERALELRPGYDEAMHNLGLLHYGRGEWAAALRLQRRRARLDPHDRLGVASLAHTLLDLGFEDEAGEWLGRLAEVEPHYVLIHQLLAQHELRVGDIQSARERMRRVLEVHKSDDDLLMIAGHVELVDGRDEAAETYYREALELTRGVNPYAEIRIADIRWRRGERGEVAERLEYFYQAGRRDFASGNQAWHRPWTAALVAALRGDSAEAIDWLEKTAATGRLDYRWDLIDPAFASLRGAPGFQRLVEGMREGVQAQRQIALDNHLAADTGTRFPLR